MFEYEKATKNAYKSDAVAQQYHDSYERANGFRGLRFRIIAARERTVIRSFLSRVGFQRLLDIPCGTGKLAEVLTTFSCEIVGSDISQQMLKLAETAYNLKGVKAIFKVCDAEHIHTEFGVKSFDVVVCLRLMHRVPASERVRMLASIAQASDYSVISFGLDSPFHRMRRLIRNLFFGGGNDPLCTAPISQINSEIESYFTIIGRRSVVPLLSEQVVYLLKAR